ncbi:MAG: fimbrillin family protein [Bacteroidaceae bacterium]|nr:fimbrillin family protein [Bacteroidaceae bacterium]
MKKNLWMLGAAVAALTSCTESEVVDVPESRVISFQSYVDNGTRAVHQVNKDNIRNFYVFGWRKVGNGTFNDPVLSNVHVSSTNGTVWGYSPHAYWQTNSTYRFAGYANGDIVNQGDDCGLANENVGYNADTDVVTFTNYSVSDKDLIVAISGDKVIGNTIGVPGTVDMSFRHMLSMVKFTFLNASGNSTLKIKNLKINNLDMTATGTFAYSNKKAVWNIDQTRTGVCNILSGESVLSVESEQSNSVDCLVIPQNSNGPSVSFTAETYDNNGDLHDSKNYTANLTIPEVGEVGTKHTNWINSFIYNYQITIGETLSSIVFNVTTVEPWLTDYNDDDNHENDNITITPSVSN